MEYTLFEFRAAFRALMAGLLATALAVSPTAAQDLVPPAEAGRFELAVMAAGLEGAGELEQNTRFDRALGYGGALTYWAVPGIGVRVRALRAEPSIRTDDISLARTDPDVWLLTANLVGRARVDVAGRPVLPYVRAGVGTKRYGFDEPYWAPAFDIGGGVELGTARVRAFLEGGHVFSELHRMGFWEGQSDWFYGAGITVTLDQPGPPEVAYGFETW